MRPVKIAITILFGIILFAGCDCPQAPATTSEPAQQQLPEQATEPVAAAAMNPVEALGKFVQIRKAKPVDFIALTKLYDKRLAAYVKGTDGRYGTQLDTTVKKALAQGLSGQDVFANAQIAEKSIQRAFLLTFARSLKILVQAPEDKNALLRITESAPVVRATTERRSKWAGRGNEYVAAFNAAMGQIHTAAHSGDAKELADAEAQLGAMWRKVIVLSVFYELDGLAKTRGAKPDAASEKRAEAYVYYLNLAEVHKERSEAGARTVAEQLSQPPEKVDLIVVQTILANDFATEIAGIDRSLLGL